MQVEMAMAGLLFPPTTFFTTPRCSPPPSSWWPSRRSTTTTTTRRRRRLRSSSSINESYYSTGSSTTAADAARTTATVKLTYLEFNGWVWELDGGFRILVDPILVGNLDFGMPWLFDGAHKTLRQDDLADLINLAGGVDLLLITNCLDDHCHLRTLTRISAASPRLPVVATPNARPVVSALPFTDVTYLEPGQSAAINGAIEVLASAGPVLGPPWQRPENGYILTTTAATGQHSYRIHYEPHCMYDAAFLRDMGLRADIVITPVVKQLLPPGYALVRGQEDAIDLAKLLQPSYVVPVSNGEFNAKGLLTAVLATQGTTETFKTLLREALPEALVMEPTPGVPLYLHLHSSQSS